VHILLRSHPRRITDLYNDWSLPSRASGQPRSTPYVRQWKKSNRKSLTYIKSSEKPRASKSAKPKKASELSAESQREQPIRQRNGEANARHQAAWRERRQTERLRSLSRLDQLEKIVAGLAAPCQENGCQSV
jgi:hypothetical protein